MSLVFMLWATLHVLGFYISAFSCVPLQRSWHWTLLHVPGVGHQVEGLKSWLGKFLGVSLMLLPHGSAWVSQSPHLLIRKHWKYPLIKHTLNRKKWQFRFLVFVLFAGCAVEATQESRLWFEAVQQMCVLGSSESSSFRAWAELELVGKCETRTGSSGRGPSSQHRKVVLD